MKRYTVLVTLTFAPAALLAQVAGQASSTGTAAAKVQRPAVTADAQASAQASVASKFKAPKGWTAEGQAKLEAMYTDAEKQDLPREPMQKRVAEGSAKGASETTILASTGKVKANMEAAHEAMVEAGRKSPSQEETARGASAMEHGVTKAQIEAMAEKAPSDRSLVVAFDVLSRLRARGVSSEKAFAQVSSKLEARASDEVLLSLVPSVNGNANAGIGVAAGGGASGGASGTSTTSGTGTAGRSGTTMTGTAAGAAGTTTGVAAGVTTKVTGVVKRP